MSEAISTVTNDVELKATRDQIERANAAVEANLNDDGLPKYDSAFGYACALAAIIQSDTRATPSPSGEAERLTAHGRYFDAEGLEGFASSCSEAAAAIVALSAEVERLKETGRRLLQALDRHGDDGLSWRIADEEREFAAAVNAQGQHP